jgi:transcriptional regulator with XRE-family HTH domain
MNFPQHLAEILKARKLTQSELAGKMRVSGGFMSDLMHGKRAPTPDIINRLSRALKLDEADKLALHISGARSKGYEV